MYAIFIAVMSSIAVVLLMWNHWAVAENQLKTAYWLMIISNIFLIIINSIVVARDPADAGILMFHIVNLWAIMMGYRGLTRLSKKNT